MTWLRRGCRLFLWLTFIGAIAVLLLWVWVCAYPQDSLTVESGEVKADVIIVLGGARDERPQRAARLYKQGAAPRIIVSGYGDCDANVRLLIRNGVPAEVITWEPDSTSTYENAIFSIPLMRRMGAHQAIIVTSWFHSRRALTCFQQCAPDMKFFSRPSYLTYQDTPAQPDEVRDYVRIEYLKTLFYLGRYGVWPFYRN